MKVEVGAVEAVVEVKEEGEVESEVEVMLISQMQLCVI